MPNYKLNTLCKHLNHSFIHREATQDAIASGFALNAAIKKHNVSSINENVGNSTF